MNALVAIRAFGLDLRNRIAARQTETAQAAIAKSAASAKTVASQTAQSAAANSAATTKAISLKAASATSDGTSGARIINKELDRDAFLQLLVYQLQNQDPMAPTDNSQMIAQLAQFSSLEQMNTLNDSFTNLKSEVDQLNFVSAGALVGRKVTGTDADGNVVTGKVDGVSMSSADGGGVFLVVGDKTVSMSNVQKIE